jgi:hypothetical protein
MAEKPVGDRGLTPLGRPDLRISGCALWTRGAFHQALLTEIFIRFILYGLYAAFQYPFLPARIPELVFKLPRPRTHGTFPTGPLVAPPRLEQPETTAEPTPKGKAPASGGGARQSGDCSLRLGVTSEHVPQITGH